MNTEDSKENQQKIKANLSFEIIHLQIWSRKSTHQNSLIYRTYEKLPIALALILISFTKTFSQSFVSPIGFVETEKNKENVIAFIKKQVKDDYTAIGMNDPLTLRMMEEENLKAFKELTKISNNSLLSDVIKTYCAIRMCNYSTTLMMYKEQHKANNKSLEW